MSVEPDVQVSAATVLHTALAGLPSSVLRADDVTVVSRALELGAGGWTPTQTAYVYRLLT